MSDQLNDELNRFLEACKNIPKSEDGEFSFKWLRSAGCKFHHSILMKLVALGYLRVRYNGVIRRGTA